MEDKRILRNRVRGLMDAQTPEDRRRKSLAVGERLFALEKFRRAPVVCFYAAMPHEIDTAAMIDRALAAGMRVCMPRCDMETIELTLYEIQSRAHLQKGTWGILEPEPDPARVVRTEEVRCILVPGVAFDAEGNRIGNGKGFYDRFLKKLAPGAVKIGLAYSLQMVPRVPVDAHDVKLDLVLTD
jgi:5-formyltetrahydrofolate cyclo-ligase